MEIRDLFQRHLPTLLALHISSLVQRGNTLVLTLASQRQQGQCPACGYHSFSVHSYYGRTLMDVPCLGHQVTLRLITRRFRCSVANCPKRTFAERFGDFATPYSRLTERLKRMMVGVAVSIGGEPGARLLHHFDIDSSADRLLAMTHALDVPVVECPTALGIDDFAFCRNRSYGTVMVNLDTGRTVDLLPDRQANTVTAWLEAHPTIEVIARDRSREYATGISQGAPQAVQVLDRWHVLKNLREAVEHDLLREQPEIIKLFAANENELAPARRYGKEYLAHQAAVARRQSQHQQVHTLHAQGTHPEDIAKRVKVSLSTVYRIRRQDHPPEPVRLPKQASVLDPYLPYLQQRWAEGCTVAQELFREVQQQGYRGSVGRVRSWLRQRCHLPADVGVPSAAPIRTTAKALSWLLFREQASLNAGEEDTLQTLITAFPEFAQLRRLTAGFRQALKDKKVEGLRIWRKEVGDSDLPHLRQFSHRLGNEWAELEAACLLPYSNGLTEGVVNRVKVVKRQMFGRGSFNLLRKRVLLAA